MKDPRDLKVPVLPSPIKQEPATSKSDVNKAKTPFSMMKPAVKTEPKKTQEKVKSPPPAKSPETKPEEIVKVEKKSPEENQASKAPAQNKKTQLKNQKPVVKGKSISSFFSSKPSSSKPLSIPEKKEPEPKNSRKRSSSPEEVTIVETKKPVEKKKVEPKKPAAKKIKLKEPNNKRSRIRVMEDSSEEEEEVKEPEDSDSKFIKFDRELTPERGTSPSQPETPEKKSEEVEVVAGSKRKAKRWVTKRFATEDGFIRTERVQEEYSASDDENDENQKKNSSPKAKPVAEKKSAEKKQAKAKPAPATKGKQGNIMSFFSKK
jgi:DNA polymerase subunit Cdc27